MSRTLNIVSAALPTLGGVPALALRRIDGAERLSSLYAYTLELVTPDAAVISESLAANVNFKQLVGKEVTVRIALEGRGSFTPGSVGGGRVNEGQGVREISGVITRARFVRVENRRGVYEAEMEPWLTLATRSSDFRIFQGLNALGIVREVLGKYDFSVETRTSEAYPNKDFVVQYGETDFAFVSRIMEEWGIYYYFEHTNGVHRMILVDAQGAHKPNLSVAYQDVSYYPPGHKVDTEHFNHVSFEERLETGVWASDDFDFKQPNASLMQRVDKPRNTGQSFLQRYQWPNDSYDPHKNADAAQGQMLSRIRVEEAGCTGQIGTMGGNLRGMACGHTFVLRNYPQRKYGDGEYLIVSSALSISDVDETSGETTYACSSWIEAMPTEHSFRAARLTPIPKTTGPQTAIVTGPAGREIWTDQYGRVKLSFHWNRYCPKDENSSCWVRVSSPWAGNNFGGMAIPRIGQEVVVDFENGDPDRPIVIGRVYNALNMPPWELPGNQTQSGLLTRSTEQGGPANANALRFEDKKGQEEVWLHAEKDQHIEVENDESHTVGHDRTKTIGHDETNHIKNDRTETVDGHEKITVHKTRTEEVDGHEKITIHQTRTEEVDGDETLTVHSDRTRTVDGSETESIGKTKTETIALAHMQSIGLGKMVNVGAAYNINVGGLMATVVGAMRTDQTALNHGVNVGNTFTLEAGDKIELKVGDSSLVMKSDGVIELKGKDIKVVGSGDINLQAAGDMAFKATKIDQN